MCVLHLAVFLAFGRGLQALGGVPSFHLLKLLSNALKTMSGEDLRREIWPFHFLVSQESPKGSPKPREAPRLVSREGPGVLTREVSR